MLASSLLEALILKFVVKRQYDWRSSIAMPGTHWLYEHRMLEPSKYGVWSYVLLFFALELVYYGWHRPSHRSRWFWTHHAVHHSPSDFKVSAAYRLGWTS
jgi:sterol desaturase/sphingolipid hydroxylase (fatty acid hydroxylase superfamily)